MTYPSYPEYQEASPDWLAQMPSHWSVKRLRHVTDLNPGKSRVRGYDPEMETTFLPMEAVGEDGTLELTATRPLSDVIDGYTYFQEDDVAYAKITPCFENGKAAILRGLKNGIGFGTTELTVLQPHSDQATPDYLFRVITSEPFRSLGESSMYGAGGQKRVPDNFARNFSIPWPPLPEQTQIARFLDHQTARIDALIAEQQRLIELLKEKRQAVISHAVTKGLDPDVAMKDSGVDSLGKIPQHWQLSQLMHLTPAKRQIMYGIVLPGPHFPGGVPIVKGGDVKPGRLSPSLLARTDPDIEKGYERSRLQEGDIVYSIRGGVGEAELVPKEIEGSNLTQDAARISPMQNTNRLWLLYALKSKPVFAQLEAGISGATIKGINIFDLKRARIPVPPEEEQDHIADDLRYKNDRFNQLLHEAKKAIRLLSERRSALISAAVTGKIDVRHWQPPTSDTVPEHARIAGATA